MTHQPPRAKNTPLTPIQLDSTCKQISLPASQRFQKLVNSNPALSSPMYSQKAVAALAELVNRKDSNKQLLHANVALSYLAQASLAC
jgi:hypothetical protein